MRVTCKHCGGAHPAFECRKKSVAARKDVRQVVGSDGFRKAIDPSNAAGEKAFIAGTQALPIDTNPEQRGRREAKAKNREVQDPAQEKSANLTRGVTAGETATKFDRKSWMREYQRNYMRNVYRPKLKASKSNPNTPERNDE